MTDFSTDTTSPTPAAWPLDGIAAGRPPVPTEAPRAEGRGSLLLWVGMGISVLFLYVFLRNVEWGELGASLSQARYVYIWPTLGFWFLSLFLRTLRWQVMVRHLKPVGLGRLASSITIGFMATGILPARAGEIVRAAVLARREGLKISGVFATIVVERIFDVLAILFFMTLALLYLPASGAHAQTLDRLRMFGGLFAVAIAVAVAFLGALRACPDRVKKLIQPLVAFLPPAAQRQVHSILDNFTEGLGILKSWTDWVAIGALSLLTWLVIGLINWSLSFAFEIPMSVLGGCLIFVVTAFAIAVPQAPSFIGVFHVAVETSLALLDVATVAAKSYAIVLWAVSLFPPILLGFILLWREGLTLGELRGDAGKARG